MVRTEGLSMSSYNNCALSAGIGDRLAVFCREKNVAIAFSAGAIANVNIVRSFYNEYNY